MLRTSFPQLRSRFRAAYFAHPERFRTAFLGLLAIIILVTSLQYAAKVAKPAENGHLSRSAFLRWRAMILDVFAGANVYVGKNEYPNPPVMAIVLRPFAELPPVVGAMTWFYAKVLMAVLAAVWTFRLVGGQPHAPAPSPVGGGGNQSPAPLGGGVGEGYKAAAILLALPAIIGDLSHNNVNIFILFLVAACLELYRRRRDFGAGLVLGFAIACKVTPLLVPRLLHLEAGLARGGCLSGGVGALAGHRAGRGLWLGAECGTLHRLVSPHDRAAGPEGGDHHRAPRIRPYRVSSIAYSRTARRSSTTRRRRRATFPCRPPSTT